MDDLGKFTQLIFSWIRAGLNTEEIMERLDDPSGVGRRLLERAVQRRKEGEAYLGRAPKGSI